MRSVAISMGLLSALPSCGKNPDPRPAVATVMMVGAVAANRAVTGGCWAQCGAGQVCDEVSGLCQRGECVPGCPVGQHCVRDPKRRHICMPNPGALSPRRAPPAPSASRPAVPARSAGSGDGGTVAGEREAAAATTVDPADGGETVSSQ